LAADSQPVSISFRTRCAAAAVTVAVPLALAAPAAHAAPSAQARLALAAHSSPARKVTAIVQFKPRVSVKQARRLVHRRHGRITRRLGLIHGFALKIRARQAARLDRDRRVVAVTLDTTVHGQGASAGSLGTTFPLTVGADKLWAQGITGAGVGVAVIDSGVSGDRPDFQAADGTSRIAANVVVNPDATTPGDPVGHGTHVAGIIAGNSWNLPSSDPNRGRYVGIAPDADLITLKIADDQGESTILDVITALQFAVQSKDQLHIRVVNLSISSDTPDSYLTDPLDAAVEAAWHSGIVVVVADGNRGDAADAADYAPANDPFVISVGGTDEHGTPAVDDDTVADWSSRGTTQDGFAKPDVLAPGAHMISTLADGSAYQQLCPQCVVGGDYLQISGTSMAAPVVSGEAALLLQARPELTPDQVKQLLTSTRRGLGETAVDVAAATPAGPGANQGVTPNPQVPAMVADGQAVDAKAAWIKAAWIKAAWIKAAWIRADWVKASWTCADCRR
jgi:serine protease AprX